MPHNNNKQSPVESNLQSKSPPRTECQTIGQNDLIRQLIVYRASGNAVLPQQQTARKTVGNSALPQQQSSRKTVAARPVVQQEVRDRERLRNSASESSAGPSGNRVTSSINQAGLGRTGGRGYDAHTGIRISHDTHAESASRLGGRGATLNYTRTNAIPGTSSQRLPRDNAHHLISRAPPVVQTRPVHSVPQQMQYFSQVRDRQNNRASLPSQQRAPGVRIRNVNGTTAMKVVSTKRILPPIFPPHDGSHNYRPRHMVPSALPSVSAPRVNAPVKSTKPTIFPIWQREDEEYERTHPSKRPRKDGDWWLDSAKRLSISANRRHGNADAQGHRRAAELDERPKAYMSPKLRLTVEGERISDDEMDEDPPVQPPMSSPRHTKQVSRKTAHLASARKTAAARKRESIDVDEDEENEEDEKTSRSSSDPSTEEDGSDQLDSSSDEQSTEDEQELRQSRGRLHLGEEVEEDKDEDDDDEDEDDAKLDIDIDEDVKPVFSRGFSPPEIIFLDSPPLVNIPLPQAAPRISNANARTPASSLRTMPEELIRAVDALTLPSILLKERRRLPFLRRNLRLGFADRCRALKIVTEASSAVSDVSLGICYEYLDDFWHEATVYEWLCPMCTLHMAFKTREMLAFHLRCDHQEVYIEWERVDEQDADAWRVKVLIPETPLEDKIPLRNVTQPRTEPSPSLQESRSSTIRSPTVESPSSPFPFVTLSPPSTRPSTSTSATSILRTIDQKSLIPNKLLWQDLHQETPPRSPSTSAPPSSTTRRSTTASSSVRSSTTISTATTTSMQRPPHDPRYPIPPPPDDPLGPAARPPYLPAESEYGGPTVYYSYRPGGACLFDLLNTLPLEPFGVLDWAVLDREEEIYESDDVKEEYKVMHALWARWIMLNRNKFIADYYKGTIAFVDEYWKMVHRAAGWDALRYWLLMLLANRFLTGREVGNVLKHYENHTGMEFW